LGHVRHHIATVTCVEGRLKTGVLPWPGGGNWVRDEVACRVGVVGPDGIAGIHEIGGRAGVEHAVVLLHGSETGAAGWVV
jgi:hypothetical protein